MTARRAAAACALALGVAQTGATCSGEGSGIERSVVGDTVIVRTPSGARVDTARLDEVARHTLPQPAAPLRITAIAADALGRIHAATNDGAIRRLRADHQFETMVEAAKSSRVQDEVRALIVESDSSVIVGLTDGRVERRMRRGEPQPLLPAREIAGLSAAQQLFRLEDGRIYLGLSPLQGDTTRPSARAIAGRLDRDRLRDTIYVPAPAAEPCEPPDPHFRSAGFADMRVRYRPSLLWAPLPAGHVVIACNARYAFATQHDAGTLRVEHFYSPVEVSADERVSFMTAWTLRLRNATDGPGADWTWRGDSLPSHKPAFHAMFSASDGRIWIWPAQISRIVPAPPQWVLLGGPRQLWVEPQTGAFDVFAMDGAFVGRVVVNEPLGYSPASVNPGPLIRGDTLWWVVSSDSTEQTALLRTHVRWPARTRARDAIAPAVRAESRAPQSQ
jgi:hypothetical protein